MALTTEDLRLIGEVMDERLEKRLEESLSRQLDRTIDERFKPVYERLDKMDSRFDVLILRQELTEKKLDALKFDLESAKREIRKDIHKLNDEMETVIQVLKQHELLPA